MVCVPQHTTPLTHANFFPFVCCGVVRCGHSREPLLNHAGCVISAVYRIFAIATIPDNAGATHTCHVPEGTTYTPLFIQQMEGACEEGGRGGGGQMRDRVGEGYKLILQQKTRGTGIEN